LPRDNKCDKGNQFQAIRAAALGLIGRIQSAASLVIVLMTMKTKLALRFIWCVLLGGVQVLNSAGQGTAFTYQGSLNAGGAAANGFYDIRFAIYDNSIGNTAFDQFDASLDIDAA
jgi:hypothetical protein